MSTGNCDAYLKPCSFCDQCLMCLLARDPMCAWSSANKVLCNLSFYCHFNNFLIDLLRIFTLFLPSDLFHEVKVPLSTLFKTFVLRNYDIDLIFKNKKITKLHHALQKV